MCLVCTAHSEEELCDLNTTFLETLKEQGAMITKLVTPSNPRYPGNPSQHILNVSLGLRALERVATSVHLSMPLKETSSLVSEALLPSNLLLGNLDNL